MDQQNSCSPAHKGVGFALVAGTALEISLCGPEAAAELHRLTQRAFATLAWLDPPSGALAETEEAVRRDLEQHAGLLATLGGSPVGGLRFLRNADGVHVRRVAVDPAFQRRGIGRALMEWMRAYAVQEKIAEIEVGVRSQLSGNRAFYEHLGYQVVRAHSHPGRQDITWYAMRRRVMEG